MEIKVIACPWKVHLVTAMVGRRKIIDLRATGENTRQRETEIDRDGSETRDDM